MLKVLENIINFIFPSERSAKILEAMSASDISEAIARAEDIPDKRFKALFNYKDPFARQAVWEIKYHANKNIAEKISILLYEFILEELSDMSSFGNFTNPLAIPVPSGRKSIRERGFNQCELILKMIRKADEGNMLDFSFDSVKKISETEKQAETKNRSERIKNLSGSFYADPSKVSGRCIVIIDDVITTSSTMKEMAKILMEAGAKKVSGFSIAH